MAAANDLVIRALAFTDPFLWIGTNRNGLWRLDTREAPSTWEKVDRWVKIEGLPDQNVTALEAGEGGELYVGVGVATTGIGADVKGGIIRIDSQSRIHALDQPGAPPLAPDRLVWRNGLLWAQNHRGIHRFDSRASTWDLLFPRRAMYISGGASDHILLVDATRRPFTAYWATADSTGTTAEIRGCNIGTTSSPRRRTS